ncbi:hypothetical protein [Cotesia plutellae polydnavirus]|nr:hypothetical protein [Cotesia plutellae polydnavirus]AEE09455.1 conserved hypothetical protein [Cotesia vestalis bracovirus]QZB49116.1 hyp [Cotesia vestalis bracovirus]
MAKALLILSLLACLLIMVVVNAKPTEWSPPKFDVVFTKGSRADGWDTGLFKVILKGSDYVEPEKDSFY